MIKNRFESLSALLFAYMYQLNNPAFPALVRLLESKTLSQDRAYALETYFESVMDDENIQAPKSLVDQRARKALETLYGEDLNGSRIFDSTYKS